MKMTRSVTLSTLAVIAFSHAFSARADNVFVDQSGQNTGNLTNGALLFGGQEPVDPVDCLVAHPIVGHGAVQPAEWTDDGGNHLGKDHGPLHCGPTPEATAKSVWS
jgi:hypothetical protein